MTSYIRYHVPSGHIDTKLVLFDEMGMSVYEQDGYDLMEADIPLGADYVVDGVITPRVAYEQQENYRNGTMNEDIVLTGLPTDMWVAINYADPIKVNAEGNVIISRPADETLCKVVTVGKYRGGMWNCRWDNLNELRNSAKEAIDKSAEAARLRVITSGAGQAMTYLRKSEAARRYLNAESISAPQLRRLQDEAARLNISVEAAAERIVTMSDAWEELDGSIDSIRLQSKAGIDAAQTGEEMQAVISQIRWPI